MARYVEPKNTFADDFAYEEDDEMHPYNSVSKKFRGLDVQDENFSLEEKIERNKMEFERISRERSQKNRLILQGLHTIKGHGIFAAPSVQNLFGQDLLDSLMMYPGSVDYTSAKAQEMALSLTFEQLDSIKNLLSVEAFHEIVKGYPEDTLISNNKASARLEAYLTHSRFSSLQNPWEMKNDELFYVLNQLINFQSSNLLVNFPHKLPTNVKEVIFKLPSHRIKEYEREVALRKAIHDINKNEMITPEQINMAIKSASQNYGIDAKDIISQITSTIKRQKYDRYTHILELMKEVQGCSEPKKIVDIIEENKLTATERTKVIGSLSNPHIIEEVKAGLERRRPIHINSNIIYKPFGQIINEIKTGIITAENVIKDNFTPSQLAQFNTAVASVVPRENQFIISFINEYNNRTKELSRYIEFDRKNDADEFFKTAKRFPGFVKKDSGNRMLLNVDPSKENISRVLLLHLLDTVRMNTSENKGDPRQFYVAERKKAIIPQDETAAPTVIAANKMITYMEEEFKNAGAELSISASNRKSVMGLRYEDLTFKYTNPHRSAEVLDSLERAFKANKIKTEPRQGLDILTITPEDKSIEDILSIIYTVPEVVAMTSRIGNIRESETTAEERNDHKEMSEKAEAISGNFNIEKKFEEIKSSLNIEQGGASSYNYSRS